MSSPRGNAGNSGLTIRPPLTAAGPGAGATWPG